jgi:hypothetical protein
MTRGLSLVIRVGEERYVPGEQPVTLREISRLVACWFWGGHIAQDRRLPVVDDHRAHASPRGCVGGYRWEKYRSAGQRSYQPLHSADGQS